MQSFLARMAISMLLDEEKRKYILAILFVPVFLFFLIVIVLPSVLLGVLTSTPMVEDEQILNTYIPVVEYIEENTRTKKDGVVVGDKGIEIDVAWLLAIDAIMLEQDFSKSNKSNVENMAWKFVHEWEEEEVVEDTYIDEEGNEVPYTYTITWTYYKLKSIEEVLEELIRSNKITRDESEDIIAMIEIMQDIANEVEYGDYSPEIEGSNGWFWVTPSTNITSNYGYRVAPVPGASTFHPAIDIGAIRTGVAGDPVWAMADGKVIQSSYGTKSGNYIAIDHGNGVKSRYLHLHNRNVKVGDTVTKGQVIGRMGGTGLGTGVHLHFEIHLNNKTVNPLGYFDL